MYLPTILGTSLDNLVYNSQSQVHINTCVLISNFKYCTTDIALKNKCMICTSCDCIPNTETSWVKMNSHVKISAFHPIAIESSILLFKVRH